MNYSSDFRRMAREALNGRWGLPILAALIVSMLGGGESATFGGSVNIELPSLNEEADQSQLEALLGEELVQTLVGLLPILVVVLLVMAVVYLIVGSVVAVGHCQFNLDLIDGESLSLATLFRYFRQTGNMVLATIGQTLFIALWTLLFIIPGIMKAYSYSMTYYILAEDPEMPALDAITRSKELMEGNRWRLFCLELSFIGWDLLSLLSLGIAQIWIAPYKAAARAAFYRELCPKKGEFDL